MADIRKCKIGEFVQIITKGQANRRGRIVSKTEKRAYCFIMEGGKYLRDENGREKRFLVNPTNIKFYSSAE